MIVPVEVDIKIFNNQADVEKNRNFFHIGVAYNFQEFQRILSRSHEYSSLYPIRRYYINGRACSYQQVLEHFNPKNNSEQRAGFYLRED